MKNASWLLIAMLCWTLGVTFICAAEPAPDISEDEAFKQFNAAMEMTDSPSPDDLTEQQVIEWRVKYAERIVEAADNFLRQHPKSAQANKVRLTAAQSLAALWRWKKEPSYRERAETFFQQVLQGKPDTDTVVGVKALRLDLLETPDEIAKAVETIVNEHPHHPRTPEVLMYLAFVYQSADDWENAKKTAARVVAKYTESFQAQMAKELLDKLSFIGKMPELRFTDLNGKSVDIKDYRGKIVLIDFWATWCGPCLAELPNVMKTYERFHDKGFEIIGISLDYSKEAVQKFAVARKITWPQVVDEKKELRKQFRVNGIPATFLLNREGKIVKVDLRGEALPTSVEELLK